MSRLLVAQRALTVPGWVKDDLSRKAQAIPSLDLRFADNKSLVDAVTGAQLVTFTRASSATYVGSDGLIKTAVTNLLLRSEEFNDAAWTKTNSTVTTNATTAPNGTLTAEKLITNSGASSGRASVSITVATDTPATLSCYAKQGETSVFGLFISDGVTGRSADFNLITGTVSGTPTAGMTASIQPVGDGWYRCVATVTSITGTTRSLRVVQTVVANDGTSGLFIWGAQFEQASTVGEYIPTVAAINSAPRFDHNPTTGESLGLLVEEARSNLLLRSEEFDNASWVKLLATASANAISAPNGTTTADKLEETSGTGEHLVYQVRTGSNETVTLSVFCKQAERTRVRLGFSNFATEGTGAIYDLVSGSVVLTPASGIDYTNPSASISAFGNGWFRCVFTITKGIINTTNNPFVETVTGTSFSFAGTAGSGIYVWGAQLETGAFPTSYISTTAATVTRAADVASISGSNFSSWYNQTEGTVFANTSVPAVAPATSLQTQYAIHDGSADNRITVYKRANADTSARLDISAATVSSAFINAGTFGLNNLTASAVQINNFAISLNGLTAVADTAGNVPSANQMNLGSYVGATGFLNGTIRRLTYWPTRFGSEVLPRITQP